MVQIGRVKVFKGQQLLDFIDKEIKVVIVNIYKDRVKELVGKVSIGKVY